MTDQTQAAEEAAVELVAMTRAEPQFEGGPTTADVHPDEVEAWIAHGWRFAGGEAPEGGDASATASDKPLGEQTLEELRATARAEGVAFTPRTGLPKLIADITGAREAAAVANALEGAGDDQSEGGND